VHSGVGEDSSVVLLTVCDLYRYKQCNWSRLYRTRGSGLAYLILLTVRIVVSLLLAVLVVGYLLHSEGVVWRHSAIYWYYQYQRHVNSVDLIVTLVSVVEKSLAPAGTRTPVPRLSTQSSISHCAD
jgi:hypothetical protein